MKCPNCNFKMKRNFCTHCGYMTNGNFINTKKVQEDSLLELYFGKNYEKITSNNNYIVPFIIGPVYIFCHDFYIEGIILILIEYLISTIFLCFNHAFLYVYVVKLLNFMTKAQDIIDNVDKKINTLNPVFDIINAASFKVNRVFDRFLDFFTSVFTKIFLKGKEREEDENE